MNFLNRIFHTSIFIFLILPTLLVGCSENQPNPKNKINTNVIALIKTAEILKSDINTLKLDKIKLDGKSLEEAWAPFEDEVKDLYPDYYAKIEDLLDPVIAASHAEKLDQKILNTLNDQLIMTLNELAEKNKAAL